MSSITKYTFRLLLAMVLFCLNAGAAHGADGTGNSSMTIRSNRSEYLGEWANEPNVSQYVQRVNAGQVAIKDLRGEKTAIARAALLRLAYGEYKRGNLENAGYAYAESLVDNQSETRALLAAENAGVIRAGLVSVRGLALDDELFHLFQRVLLLPNSQLRQTSAEVLAQAPGAHYAEAKARLIARSIMTTPNNPDAANRVPANDSLFDYEWRNDESACVAQAFSLGQIKGVSKELLAQLTPPEPGLPHDCLVIARTMAGDASIRAQYYAVVTNSSSLYCRISALGLFVRFPSKLSPDDVLVLEQVAANDAFQARGNLEGYRFLNRPMEKPLEKIYWLREIAKRILQERGKGAETSGQNK